MTCELRGRFVFNRSATSNFSSLMQEWCDPHQKADFPARVYRELLLQVILFGRMVVPEASPTHPLTIIHDRRDRFQMRRNWSLHRPIDHGRQQAEYGRISCAWLF